MPRSVGLLLVPMAVSYPFLPRVAASLTGTGFGVLCIALMAAGVRRSRPDRPAAWWLLTLGMGLLVAGDACYSVLDVRGTDPPFPSFADAVYLSGYPVLFAGLALVVRRGGGRDSAAWLDAGIWTGGAVVAAWLPLLSSYAHDGSLSPLARWTALAYPLLDLVLLFLVLHVVGRRARGAERLVALSMALMLVADAVYGLRELQGVYSSGEVTDLGWLMSYLAAAVATWHPSLREAGQAVRRPELSQRRMLALSAPALAAPALLGYLLAHGDLTGDRTAGYVVAGTASALFVLAGLRGRLLLQQMREREERLEAALRDRERLAEELRQRVTSCALTGLVNRSGFLELVTSALESPDPLAIGLLDLDDFKGVNDTLGHEAGDALLVTVAEHLRSALGPNDVVGRLGGDEFALLVRGSPNVVHATADRVVEVLAAPIVLEGHRIRVAGSLGIAVRSEQSVLGDLMRRADVAMYAAKGEGGNRWAHYRPAMSASLLKRLDLRSQLVVALERDELEAWFQPIVDLASGQLLGFEALARWCRPGHPVEPPGEWIALAEETGLVVAIDACMLRKAVREFAHWCALTPDARELDLGLNVSGRTLQEPGIADRILTLLREEGISAFRVVLEVTEGVLLEDEAVGRRLQQLRAAGMRIALDDFGTGWSSLAYLSRFPVDILKLDRSFTAGLGRGVGGEAVAVAVMQLALALDLEVIAEGVETEEQAERLRELGARVAQGYLFGAPASPYATRQLVSRGREARPRASSSA